MNQILNFYHEYNVYFNLLFFITLLFTLFGIRRLVKRVLKYFGDKQFEISSEYTHDVSNHSEYLLIRIYNKNIYDLRVSSFGYLYKHESIDVITLYKNQKALSSDSHITIQPRDYVELKIDPKVIRDKVFMLNARNYSVSTIHAFVTDAMGITSTSKVPLVKAYIKKALQALKRDAWYTKKTLKQDTARKQIESLNNLKTVSKSKLHTLWIDIKIWLKKHL